MAVVIGGGFILFNRFIFPAVFLLFSPAIWAQEVGTASAEDTEAAESAKETVRSKSVSIKPSGFLRLGYSAIMQDDQSPDFVGQNDGFFIESARLNVDLAANALTGRISVDGAVDEYDSGNTSNGKVTVSLLDAFLDFELLDGLKARAGQFRPEFDLEAARIRKDMVFVYRALYNRGVRGVEGFNVRGLGLSREVGVAIHGDFGQRTGFHGGYQLSLTNGVNAEASVNDNDLPAAGTRLTVGYAQLLTLGLGARYNRRTTGDTPDLIDQDEVSVTTDLQLRRSLGAYHLVLEGALTQKQIDVVDVQNEPSTTRLGYHGALMFSRGPLTLAYRYAVFDPTAAFSETSDAQLAQGFDADTMVHHTIGLSYNPEQGPLTLQANFTVAQEDEQRAYANDRLDLLAQLVF